MSCFKYVCRVGASIVCMLPAGSLRDYGFLVIPGAERMRNALSEVEVSIRSVVHILTSQCLTFVFTLVYQLNHHVNLVDRSTIEVFAYVRRQLILGNTPLVFSTRHRRRLSSNSRIG